MGFRYGTRKLLGKILGTLGNGKGWNSEVGHGTVKKNH